MKRMPKIFYLLNCKSSKVTNLFKVLESPVMPVMKL
jgi:hypothetical protein